MDHWWRAWVAILVVKAVVLRGISIREEKREARRKEKRQVYGEFLRASGESRLIKASLALKELESLASKEVHSRAKVVLEMTEEKLRLLGQGKEWNREQAAAYFEAMKNLTQAMHEDLNFGSGSPSAFGSWEKFYRELHQER